MKYLMVELTAEAAAKLATAKSPAARRGAVFSEAWRAGKEITGYSDKSPIWKKTRAEVWNMKEVLYKKALAPTTTVVERKTILDQIAVLDTELAKRTASKEIAEDAARAK